MSDNSTDRLLLRANTAIKILKTSQNTWAFQMKTWNWSRLSERGCFFWGGGGVHVFCKCLRYISNMCSHVPHAQQMLPGKKNPNATCAFFPQIWTWWIWTFDHSQKGDFCFEVMGIKTINDSLHLDSHGFSLRSNRLSNLQHTHKPFSLCSNVYHHETEQKVDFSEGHRSGYWTSNAELIEEW